MRISRTFLVAAAVAAAAFAVGGTWAFAHGGNPDTVHACVSAQSGDLRVIEADSTCRRGETPLDWNVEGKEGAQGPQGDPGVVAFYTRFNPGGACSDGFNCVAIAVCDPGDAVTGGGFERDTTGAGGGISVVQSRPTSDGIWQVILANFSGHDVGFRAYARCADVTP